jgi:hypothetical protein
MKVLTDLRSEGLPLQVILTRKCQLCCESYLNVDVLENKLKALCEQGYLASSMLKVNKTVRSNRYKSDSIGRTVLRSVTTRSCLI